MDRDATNKEENKMDNQAIVHSNGIFAWATRGDNGFDTDEEIVKARRTANDGDDLANELKDQEFNVSRMSY